MDKQKHKKLKRLWGQDADTTFVDLWEKKAEELRSTKKNSHIYVEMAADMEAAGFHFRAVDMKFKISNMTKKYRKIKAEIESGCVPPPWPYYSRIDRIITDNSIDELKMESVQVAGYQRPSHNKSPLPPWISHEEVFIKDEESLFPSTQSSVTNDSDCEQATLNAKTNQIDQQILSLESLMVKALCQYELYSEKFLEAEKKRSEQNERLLEQTSKIADAFVKLCDKL